MRSSIRRAVIFALIIFPSAVTYLATRLLYEENVTVGERSNFEEEPVISPADGTHRCCIIVPFKNRFEELLAFAPHMNNFLKRHSHVDDFRFVVVNQMDSYRFNRASLINAGYFEARRLQCDYLIMHDVDLLPLNDDLYYGFPGSGPFHIAAPQYHPRYHYKEFVGGILSVTLDHYQSVNGMSNKYWGWGLEDDEWFLRMRSGKLKLHRPKNLTTTVENTFLHLHQSDVRRRDMADVANQTKELKKRDKVSGLNTLHYEVVGRIRLIIDGAPLLVVNVKLYCDKKVTPWCVHNKR